MADLLRPRLPPIHTHHSRNVSANTVESDSDCETPTPIDEETDFLMHGNDSTSTVGALTAIRDNEMEIDMDHLARVSPIQRLPPELLINVFTKLTTTSDLRSCMLVCYHWALYTVNILWHRPLCNKWNNLSNIARALAKPYPSFPYHEMVKRLNLSAVADKVNDGTVQAFLQCKAVERLTLTQCSSLSDGGVIGLLNGTKKLQALDVTDLESLTDKSMIVVAENCPKLQGLNLTNCSFITDESLLQIALNCTQLKRLKLNGVARATDDSIIAVAEHCRSILEIDLAGCQSISSASITALLSNLPHLRELRLAQCIGIDSHAFTDVKPTLRFDALRILDLTACDGVGDDAIARIIPAAPRIRNLVLAKCRHITDRAVKAICTLTKNLHYIHLGHCQLLTDNAVIELVQQCNRIRYIDLACCSRLTDASVRHLAKLPKLRRVGLVKCQNLTDTSIIALARGPYGSGSAKPGMPTQFVSLERVHLSYCTSLTLKGITQLLLNCPRLTHLSLTGVQAFLRDDLTMFCREAPTEFTHVQRDVFCVFSGDGVTRLRDYLARLAAQQAEWEQNQQIAPDEPVLGPDSPDADSLSEGTIDGNDPNTSDLILGLGRHGTARPARQNRPASFHGLPRPDYHIDMPLLQSDQMQQFGPWTPGFMTPELRGQRTPQYHTPAPGHYFPQMFQRTPSPLPTPSLFISDDEARSRSQSRRHTLDRLDAVPGPSYPRNSFFLGNYARPNPHDLSTFPNLGPQSTWPTPAPTGLFMAIRPPTGRENATLRPDATVSTFEANHDAILSTIPNSRGPSRGPSRSSSPHPSRMQSRSQIGGYGRRTPSYADVAARTPSEHRDRIVSGPRPLPNPHSLFDRAVGSGMASSSSQQEVEASPLPAELMRHVLYSSDVSSGGNSARRGTLGSGPVPDSNDDVEMSNNNQA